MNGHDRCCQSNTACISHGSVGKPPTIQDIFQETYLGFLKRHRLNETQFLALQDILTCRKQVLGGRYSQCPACGHRKNHFNSCGNRNCPSCQWLSSVMWTRKQLDNFLPVPHHQTTMTLPAELRGLAMANPRLVYDLMVKASGQTLMELVEERYGAKVGVTTVLHTWNRRMQYHPHTHNMTSCGGISIDGQRWVSISNKYLLPVKQIQAVFKKKMLDGLVAAQAQGMLTFPGKYTRIKPGQSFNALVRRLRRKTWIVHNEAPAGKEQPVVKYLATYIRRITISNNRIKWFRQGQVCFATRDEQSETISAEEFMRRYLQHLLPKGLHKVRHRGLYSRSSLNSTRLVALSLVPDSEKITYNLKEDEELGEIEGWEDIVTALTGKDPRCCEKCGHRGLRWSYLGWGYRSLARASVMPSSALSQLMPINSS